MLVWRSFSGQSHNSWEKIASTERIYDGRAALTRSFVSSPTGPRDCHLSSPTVSNFLAVFPYTSQMAEDGQNKSAQQKKSASDRSRHFDLSLSLILYARRSSDFVSRPRARGMQWVLQVRPQLQQALITSGAAAGPDYSGAAGCR